MDKKTIILAVLCIILAFAWQPILNHFYPPPKPQPKTQAPVTNAVSAATNALPLSNQVPAVAEKIVEGTKTVEAKPPAPRPPEQEVVLENDRVELVFTSYGGGIKRAQLKKYPAHQDATHQVVLNQFAKVPMGQVEGLEGFDENTVFEIKKTGSSVTLEAVNDAGVKVTKQFRLVEEYLIEGDISVSNQGQKTVNQARLSIALGTASAVVPADKFEIPYVAWGNGKDTTSIDPPAFDSSWISRRTARDVVRYDDVSLSWAGFEDRFFCALWMPQAGTNGLVRGSVSAVRIGVQHPDTQPNQSRRLTDWGIAGRLSTPAFTIAAGETYTYPFKLYTGPKEYRRLQSLGNGLTAVMHWGWVEWIAELLLKTMTLLHKAVPNYFFVIILITIVIKLVFWPLTAMSNRSMKGMQALQPKMTALREKFKDEPQKLNAEMMRLYKEHKVNPMAGCLPTVVQIPVFIGFYYMLRSAIELRMDGFLWIHDLSQPDSVAQLGSFFINPLPILMGATMIWQMKITPSGGDPAQQKMMMLMPLMFLFFCYGMPSGLVLYWTVQNIFTIVQMKLTKPAAPGTLPPSPPAKPQKSKSR